MRQTKQQIETDHHARIATAWAAAVIIGRGCTLHPTQYGGWDVELRDGSWRAANDWRELCNVAHALTGGTSCR